jgi:hypothetical protein
MGHKVDSCNTDLHKLFYTPEFWKNIFSMSKGMAVLLILGFALKHALNLSLSWKSFMFYTGISTVFYAAIMYFWCMNESEKALCQQVLRKIRR